MAAGLLGFILGAALVAVLAGIFHHDVMRLATAREWLARGAVLVDVDDEGEFARHHPQFAVNVPLADLPRRAHELGGFDKPIVVYAHRWRRGARAVQELRAIGYHDLLNAAGARVREKLSAAAARTAQGRTNAEELDLAPEGS